MRHPLTTRLERLEAGFRQHDVITAERQRLITRRAFQHLSTEELQALREAKRSSIEGRTWTEQELAAVKAFQAAMEVERQRGGRDT